jgi:outer membrane protein OmpA-like peptidoglycan-associated protein
MRPSILLLASLLFPADPASAQVTVDLRALDALPNARPATTRPEGPAQPRAPRQRAAVSTRASAQADTSKRSGGTGSSGSTTPAMAGTAPASPPPDATLPAGTPPLPPSLQASAAPPGAPAAPEPATPVQVVASAVRVMFPPAKADLGATETEVIKQLVDSAPRSDGTTFNVVAYAAATPEDPSAARRLSLSRALAVRNALMADGIQSSRIYVRALGPQSGDGPADRADISVLGTNAPSSGTGNP